MANSKHRDSNLPSASLPLFTKKPPISLPVEETGNAWIERLWREARRYPLPFGATILMVISLLLWLTGYASLTSWPLLLVVLVGGFRLLWQTTRHLLRREFSVDVIALLAISGSFLLGQYLAGAVIVLMYSGGEALEAFAVRRARTSLAALAQRVPQTAHIWQGEELVSIPADQVEVGMEVVLKPGELAPVDGVVATPCPLILATPIAIMSGIDRAARNGIITKSGASIEQLGEIDTAVFDKTGTLTLGMPKVTTIVCVQPEVQYTEAQGKPTPMQCAQHALYDEETLLRLTASIEQLSTHILARAVVELAQERGISLCEVDDFEEIFGKGVRGWVLLHGQEEQRAQGEGGREHEKTEVAVGNRTFMKYLSIAIPPSLLEERQRRVNSGQICSFLAVNKQIEGLLVLEDVPRPEISRLSADLHTAGVKETILLTGDNEVVAQKIGELAQVDRVVARCLPEDKVRIIEELVAQKHGVLMVGDGINDAPALATATIGMALGTQGLTAAATATDTVLLSTDILRVVRAVLLGRWVMHVARQGIWVGMGLSVIAMFFAAFGFIPPAVGALLQEAIDVVVILNALRAGRGSLDVHQGGSIPPNTPPLQPEEGISSNDHQMTSLAPHSPLEEDHHLMRGSLET